MKTYRIYYMKPDYFREFSFGDKVPSVATVIGEKEPRTHVFLRTLTADDLNGVFRQMQGENWSPNGEARSLIEQKALGHTSMSVGDVVVDGDHFWVVAPVGFTRIY